MPETTETLFDVAQGQAGSLSQAKAPQTGSPADMPPASNLPSWLDTPLARTKDDDGSQLAAHWVRVSGTLAKQERAVYRALLAHPGCTSQELAKHLDCADRYVTSRRLAGLADRGVVRRGDKRLCTVTRMLCFTWFPVGNATRLVLVPEPAIGTTSATHPAKGVSRTATPAKILSPSEKRALRERLAAEGNPAAKAVTDALDRKGAAR